MKMSFNVVIASVALSFGGAAVLAEPARAMPDADWDYVAAKLLNDGYSSIHLSHDGTNHLRAIDRFGSEVLMLVDPESRRVLSMAYVNPLDE